MSLVIFTGLCGLLAAPGYIHPLIGFVAVLCIAIGAGGAAALNQWWEADLDAGMKRTAKRPIPGGRVRRTDARDFGIALSVASVGIMGIAVNWLAAIILAISIVYYAVIYTIWLKPRTPQNIVIGGGAGAFPPMIGWVAVTGDITLMPVLLFAIIFMWTPPHFWALALFMQSDYAKVGIPMMPVVKGEASTRRQIMVYAVLLLPVAAAPWFIGGTGAIYGVIAIALSPRIHLAGRPGRDAPRKRGRHDEARKAAVRVLDPLPLRAVRRAGCGPRRLRAGAVRMTPEEEIEFKRRRKGRNLALGAGARVLRATVLHDHLREDGLSAVASMAPVYRRNARTGIIAGLIALAMLGLGFAAVPLYRIFCQVTGFAGTTQRATAGEAQAAEAAGAKIAGATVSVRFDANIDPDLPWTFRPEQVTKTVKLGQRADGVLLCEEQFRRAGDRTGELQRLARPDRGVFQQGAVLLLHRADPAAGRGSAHARAVLRRSGVREGSRRGAGANRSRSATLSTAHPMRCNSPLDRAVAAH